MNLLFMCACIFAVYSADLVYWDWCSKVKVQSSRYCYLGSGPHAPSEASDC